jgi:diguanylate cyclase
MDDGAMAIREPHEELPAATVIPLNRGSLAPQPGAFAEATGQELTRRVSPRVHAPERASPGHTHDAVRFAAQTYPLRVLGLGLGALCVGATLHAQGAPGWTWVLLVLYCFAWPHVARWRAQRHADPRSPEFTHLAIDSAMGGLWVAVMQVALLPGMVLVAMLAMDKAAVGGWRLLLRHLALQALAFGAVWLLLGMPFQPESDSHAMLAALPLLLVYPVSIAFAVHSLGVRVREQNRALDALNRTDALTGLANRRQIEASIEVEFQRCTRSGRPAVLLMVDLDGFKAINDRLGHGVGDEVLRRVALAIRGCVREIDIAARLGGDEFLVLMPETAEDAAVCVASRIRAALAAQLFERAPDLHCTASIGVAEIAPGDRSALDGVERAALALYRAKADGRDCVRVAT